MSSQLGCRGARLRSLALAIDGNARRAIRAIRAIFAIFAILILLCCALATGAAAAVRVSVGDGLTAVRADRSLLYVEAEPHPGEGLLAFARRVGGSADAWRQIAEANGGLPRLEAGRRYRVPYALLAPELRLRVARALFPDDRAEAVGWRHVVARSADPESLWRIAEWFTGNGQNFAAIRERNTLVDEPAPGTSLVIPADLLLPAFRSTLPRAAPVAVAVVPPVAPAPPPTVRPAAPPAIQPVEAVRIAGTMVVTNTNPATEPPPPAPIAVTAGVVAAGADAILGNPASSPATYQLRYDRDAAGEYAEYALRPGEALYSSVVVRFTGRIHADDVNTLAGEIAKRSGIADVTDIAIGYPVRIPIDLVQPEFLPAGHARRQEYEASLLASARFRNHVEAVHLDGVTVVLDAGHGGRDVGATLGGVWESLYAYDVMVRVRRLLSDYTAAKVVATTRDGKEWRIEDKDVLGFSRGHAVLTTPPYPIEDSKIGVNLRWYLANSVHRQATKEGTAGERLVFVSLHADSLHPSLRGAMAYIPDAALSGASPARGGGEYAARKEVREAARYTPARRDLQRYEGLSRDLAEHVIAAFREENLAVHPFKPVREKVIRGRRVWVPAVLRYNAVPAKMLLEICNLANAEDRALLQTRAYRQKVAEAVVRGILSYYAPTNSDRDAQLAKARR